MTLIFIDRALPGVDVDSFRCPGCRQTLAAILDGGAMLPPFHYRHGTRHGVRIDAKGGGGGRRNACTYDGDELSTLIFRAQKAARHDWLERHHLAGRTDVDPTLVRQQVGYAQRMADILGRELDVYDVLEALADTGVCLIRDGEGYAADARRWAVMVIAADPLDQEPPVDSHWDREREGREEAERRPNIRRLKEDT